MELNKRKSLLTPASPTVWGMIHGDIDKQEDIVVMIGEKVAQAIEAFIGVELTNRIKDEVIAEITPLLNEQYQPTLISGYNIKTLKGRDMLGEGDIDPLDDTDRTMLNTIDTKADKSNTYTKKQVDNLIANVEVDTTNLATKQDVQDLRDTDVQTALMGMASAKNTAINADRKVDELRTYVDEQIGGIDTITEDILG
jgi:hypothetical protein